MIEEGVGYMPGDYEEKMANFPYEDYIEDVHNNLWLGSSGRKLLLKLLSKKYPLPDEWQVNNPLKTTDEVEFIEQFLASDFDA